MMVPKLPAKDGEFRRPPLPFMLDSAIERADIHEGELKIKTGANK